MTGPLALVGSGEFLEEMEAIDRTLLAAASRPNGTAVVVPTASALEPGMPETWAERGIRHFADRLGVPTEAALRQARTSGITLLGIDERTALVYIDEAWRVMGAGGVTVMTDNGDQTYAANSAPPLPAPAGSG